MPGTQYGATWSRQAPAAEELKLPSGAVALVMRPTPQALAAAGVIDNMDILSGIVEEELVKPATGRAPTPTSPPLSFPESADPTSNMISRLSREQMVEMFAMIDKVIVHCVVEPRVELAPLPKCVVCGWEGADARDHAVQRADDHPLDVVPRRDDVYYTDGIDLADKVAIMNYAMAGLSGLDTFREGSGEGVASVSTIAGVPVPAVSPARDLGSIQRVDIQ